jgi:hypothetical protein
MVKEMNIRNEIDNSINCPVIASFNTMYDDGQIDSLVTSITFVAIVFHLQRSEECNYYIVALTYLF